MFESFLQDLIWRRDGARAVPFLLKATAERFVRTCRRSSGHVDQQKDQRRMKLRTMMSLPLRRSRYHVCLICPLSLSDMPRSLPVLSHPPTQQLLVLLGCYLLLQLWYVCAQALVLAAALLVFMSSLRNNVGKEGEVDGQSERRASLATTRSTDDSSATCRHTNSGTHCHKERRSWQTSNFACLSRRRTMLPARHQHGQSHSKHTLGEVLQHRYMLRLARTS